MEITELCKSNVPTRDYGPIRVANVDRSKDASTGARFGAMNIPMGFRYCVRMKKTEVEDGRVQVSREDEEEWSRRQRG
ncbi:hypothetical protein AAG906_022430 [Vitis piasezkii]